METNITITEGKESAKIHVTSPFPPGFFCGNLSNWDGCNLRIHAVFVESQCEGQLVSKRHKVFLLLR